MSFYYFSHLLQPWILPPGFNLLIIIIGIVVLRFYSRRAGKNIIIFSLATLWLFSTPVVAQLLIDQLQNQYPPLQVSQISHKVPSAIIVLGGGHEVSPETESGYTLSNATEERIHYAAYLYHKTKLPIITSGGRINKRSPSEAELMRHDMKYYFHIRVAWTENNSRNTRDEGNLMVPILKKQAIKVAYLVTNAWHMPRAIYSFRNSLKKTKIKIIAAPMGYITPANKGILNYLPSNSALNGSATAMHEYIGILAYHLRNLV